MTATALRMTTGVCIFISWIIAGLLVYLSQQTKREFLPKSYIPTKLLKSEQNLLEKIQREIPNGFIFGKDKLPTHDWVVKSENIDGHIMIVGGPGSGKTSCLAIPTMSTWKNRVFAIDIKGELYDKSNRVTAKIFNPIDSAAYGYDPFYILRSSKNKVQEIRKISMLLIPIPASVNETYWLTGAQNYLTAGLIHFQNLGFSFIECINKIQLTAIVDLTESLINSEVEEAKILARQFADANPKELKSFVGEVRNHIVDFVLDPDIKQAFSKPSSECIKPLDLERGFDVFLKIPEYKLDQWGRILSLITGQFLDHFERREDYNVTPILFLLDEFPRLGKFGNISNGLATLRSKKITMAIIIQSLAQLDFIYGDAQRRVIADNCSFKAVLGASEPTTQQYFSDLVGTALQMRETKSSSINTNPVGRIEDEKESWFFGPHYRQYDTTTSTSSSTSYSYERDRMMQPHEFGALEDIVLLVTGKGGGYFRINKTSIYDPEIIEELNIANKTDKEAELEKLRKGLREENKLIEAENVEIAEKNREITLENQELDKKRDIIFFRQCGIILGLGLLPLIIGQLIFDSLK